MYTACGFCSGAKKKVIATEPELVKEQLLQQAQPLFFLSVNAFPWKHPVRVKNSL